MTVTTPYPFYQPLCQIHIKRLYVALILVFVLFLFTAHAQPATPNFDTYKSVSPEQSHSMLFVQPFSPGYANPVLPNDRYRQQNYRIMQQAGMHIPGKPNNNQQQQQKEELQTMLRQEALENRKWKARPFQNNFQKFLQLDPNSFSITKAVYLAESSFDTNLPPYEIFEAAIKDWAKLVQQILRQAGLSTNNNTAINYAIQQLYQHSTIYYDEKSKRGFTIPPIRYDFNDPMGNKDWRKMFVSKLLQTGTGQCHSLPLFFLCIAEQLNAKAYLSLSPNHSFIQYFDSAGHRYNFECTNGNLVTQTWLMQSTYINATALKKGTYLDTLSSSRLYAQCLADLLLGYIQDMGYDGFSDQMTKQILTVDSTNLVALMTQANYYTFIFRDKLQAAGNPSKDAISANTELLFAYNAMQAAQEKITQTGFQEMPEDAYRRWLISVELEKKKQQNKLEQERLQQEIRKLKNLKSTFINKPKQ